MRSLLQRHIALPQDHGSWVFLFSPLLIGLFAADSFNLASFFLALAAFLAFLLRQPLSIAVKAYTGRRPKSDLTPAGFWALLYLAGLLLCLVGLILLGRAVILLLALPALPIFAWHLWLVSRREERRQIGVEILATGVLALSAPAAFWAGSSQMSFTGWLLWLLTWFQSAASIVYAYLRLQQRDWKQLPAPSARLQAGASALGSAAFNTLAALTLTALHRLPAWVWLAYLLQLGETLWGTLNPAINQKPVRIGLRQLAVSAAFTVLFILFWK